MFLVLLWRRMMLRRLCARAPAFQRRGALLASAPNHAPLSPAWNHLLAPPARTFAEAQLKKFRPITPGLRHKISLTRDHLWGGKPKRDLTARKTRSGGRDNRGRISVRHIGGGHKRRIRVIDFCRREGAGAPAIVERIEYDPNRSADIALLRHESRSSMSSELVAPMSNHSYILQPEGLKPGDMVVSGPGAPVRLGNALPLEVGFDLWFVRRRPMGERWAERIVARAPNAIALGTGVCGLAAACLSTSGMVPASSFFLLPPSFFLPVGSCGPTDDPNPD
jgi:hypothetical protein